MRSVSKMVMNLYIRQRLEETDALLLWRDKRDELITGHASAAVHHRHMETRLRGITGMKQKVIIKSNKYGLIVHMDPDAEYTEILKELREKFTESARFFKDATMAVTFEGRILTNHRKKRSLV